MSDIMRILHITHVSNDMMIRQCKSRLYWPGLHAELHALYQECQQCLENRASKSKPRVEVHHASIFGFVPKFVSLFVKKKFQATSKQGRRLGFGMLTALTNIRQYCTVT